MKCLLWLLASLFTCQFGLAQQRIHVSVESSQPPLLNASAGDDITLTGSDLTLGDIPSALGGLEPYTYQWLPETDLDDASASNPVYFGSEEQSFTLVVTDNRGCTARDTLSIVITGLSNIKDDNSLVVYPNPGAGIIRLKIQESSIEDSKEIRLHDSTGKLIINEIWNILNEDYLFDVSALSAGNYIISIGQGKDVITRQLIISK